jgi:alkanesulfonate monooxygenase SsuD/methylene tetrahydromethanopterin reductase-like flavin-dependent oxidoreductase (luciferase family)
MDIGWMMDCDYRTGQTQGEAFDAVLTTADLAETLGFDGIWLAERHFSSPGGAVLVPSIGSAPLLMATAIAIRTSRLRIGTLSSCYPWGTLCA